MRAGLKLGNLLAVETGILLVLPFPVAGPLPQWRAALAWVALAPLLIALLSPHGGFGWKRIGRNAVLGYSCGILWYAGTCYWIQSTMQLYGNLSPLIADGILLLFCLFLALYMALFGLLTGLAQRATGSTLWTLCLVPLLWVATELACARITSFPWNQLGYSQIDNLVLTRLAPFTGNYGISFVLVMANCAIAGVFLLPTWRRRLSSLVVAAVIVLLATYGGSRSLPSQPAPVSAILLQPNLRVGPSTNWTYDEFDRNMQRFAALSENECRSYYVGLPTKTDQLIAPECRPSKPLAAPIQVIVWPESPAPFEYNDPRFRHWVSALAEDAHVPMIVGNIAVAKDPDKPRNFVYNSAAFIAPDGSFVGRYDKIHLVPFGEYVPFQTLLSFAGSLTAEVGQMTHGRQRVAFASAGHRYGTFICYESIFADEVRQFARLGADVLVNISDDGWYGDTSAPWQHLNIARMRAIENDRWLLRDTNTGITAVIDPYGRVLQSAPRHAETALYAHFNYITHETFYTRHGDLFAWLCAIIAVVLAVDGTFHNHCSRA